MASNTRVFHCVKGKLTTEDHLCLLVWLFEVPPSTILIEGNKVTVPSTQESRDIYDKYCTTRTAYKFSAPKVIGTNYGIMLRRFKDLSQPRIQCKKMAKALYESKILAEYNVEMPHTVDRTGQKVLNNVSDGHPIAGDWNPKTCQWEFEEGMGYRNTGLILPLSCSGIKFQKNSNGLGYVGGENTRRSGSPIRFVKPAVVVDVEEGEVEE